MNYRVYREAILKACFDNPRLTVGDFAVMVKLAKHGR